MGSRNETRLRRWARRVIVAAAATLLVQLVALWLLDGTARQVVVWAPYPVLMFGSVVTVPIDSAPRARLPEPVVVWAIVAATAGGTVVPQLGRRDTGRGIAWYVAMSGVAVGGVLVAWALVVWRRHRYRRGPRRTVVLRARPAAPMPRDEREGGT